MNNHLINLARLFSFNSYLYINNFKTFILLNVLIYSIKLEKSTWKKILITVILAFNLNLDRQFKSCLTNWVSAF